jgi:hypothetical protein
MSATERAIFRFIRVIIAGAIAYGIKYLTENLTDFNIPIYLVPVVQALLNAIAKYLREKDIINLPL